MTTKQSSPATAITTPTMPRHPHLRYRLKREAIPGPGLGLASVELFKAPKKDMTMIIGKNCITSNLHAPLAFINFTPSQSTVILRLRALGKSS